MKSCSPRKPILGSWSKTIFFFISFIIDKYANGLTLVSCSEQRIDKIYVLILLSVITIYLKINILYQVPICNIMTKCTDYNLK